jgi:alanine racemase
VEPAKDRSADRIEQDGRRTVELRPTYAHIDHAALEHNLNRVRAHVGQRRVLAVVKADGYGHGAVEVARTLVRAGVWGLAVSLVEEGVELREAGIRAPVVVLGGVNPGAEDVIVHRRLIPVVWSRDHLEVVAAAVRRSGARPMPVHLKVDTGMSRLGLLPQELGPVLDWLATDAGRHVRFEGMMTHLSCADDLDDELTSKRQLASFGECLRAAARRGLEPEFRHVCNSAGLVRLRSALFDMVRPGIAIYGAASSRAVGLPGLRMAMSVHSRILGIRELPAGVRVSYGGREQLHRDSRLGIVPVGYGDGYPRSMSGRAQVLVRGHRCRVVGNITMDMCMVDVTDLPGVRAGEHVTLLGAMGRECIDVHEMADWAAILPYEVTCGISKRVPRR